MIAPIDFARIPGMSEAAYRRAVLLHRRAARSARSDARQRKPPRRPSSLRLQALYSRSLTAWRRMMTARLRDAFAAWERDRRPGLRRRDSDEDGDSLDESEAADLVYWLRRSLSDEPIRLPAAPSEAAIRALGEQAARLAEREARRVLVDAGADEAKLAGKLGLDTGQIKRIGIAPTEAHRVALEAWTRANLDLIVRIPQSWLVGTEAWMSEHIRVGARYSEVQRELVARLGIGQRHARLIARDQIGKLNSQVTNTVQALAGVDECTWVTSDDERVRGTPGGRYPRARPSHYALDGVRYKRDEPPVSGPGTQRRRPGEPIQCFAPGTRVASSVEALARSEYRGPMLTLQTAGDRRLSVTPNHPILTARGWLPAKKVKQGDHVLCAPRDLFRVGHENPDHRPAPIDEAFRLLAMAGSVRLGGPRSEDLHGDAVHVKGKIEVVGVDSALRGDREPVTLERLHQLALMAADTGNAALVPDGATGDDLGGGGLARPIPGCGTLTLDAAGRGFDGPPLQALRLGAAADVDAFLAEHRRDRVPVDAEPPGDLEDRHVLGVKLPDDLGWGPESLCVASGVGADGLDARASQGSRDGLHVAAMAGGELLHGDPGRVVADEVVDIKEDPLFTGHVYDLQTRTGIVLAEGIICSNCRCWAEPVIPDDIMADTGDDSRAAKHRRSQPITKPLPQWTPRRF